MRRASSMSYAATTIFIHQRLQLLSRLSHRQACSKLSWDTELLLIHRLDICLKLWPIAWISSVPIPIHRLWLNVLESGLQISKIHIFLLFRVLCVRRMVLCLQLKFLPIFLIHLNFPIFGLSNWIWSQLILTFKAHMADESLIWNGLRMSLVLIHQLVKSVEMLLINCCFFWCLFRSFGFNCDLFTERILVIDELESRDGWLVFSRRDALTYVGTWLTTSLFTSFHFGVGADCARMKEWSFGLLRLIGVQVSCFVYFVYVALVFKWAEAIVLHFGLGNWLASFEFGRLFRSERGLAEVALTLIAWLTQPTFLSIGITAGFALLEMLDARFWSLELTLLALTELHIYLLNLVFRFLASLLALINSAHVLHQWIPCLHRRCHSLNWIE